jgi:hypothetical protein
MATTARESEPAIKRDGPGLVPRLVDLLAELRLENLLGAVAAGAFAIGGGTQLSEGEPRRAARLG